MASNKIIDRIVKQSKLSTVIVSERSETPEESIPTFVPALNIALSGSIDGGFGSGITMIAAPSRHFKSLLMLICLKAYQVKYPNSIAVIYNSEDGIPPGYLQSLKIDENRVIVIRIRNVEELKTDIMNHLTTVESGDKIFFGIDSIGNLASKKEVQDALDDKSVADMTRAKQLKSLTRMITPYLKDHDLPLVVVNHTYKTLEMYSKDQVGGGTGFIYSSDNILMVGRRQDKTDKDLNGYEFILKVEKSRYVREQSSIALRVTFEDGIDLHSGLLELGVESGMITQPKNLYYGLASEPNEKPVREANVGPLIDKILKDEKFLRFVKNKYQLSSNSLLGKDITEEIGATDDE